MSSLLISFSLGTGRPGSPEGIGTLISILLVHGTVNVFWPMVFVAVFGVLQLVCCERCGGTVEVVLRVIGRLVVCGQLDAGG